MTTTQKRNSEGCEKSTTEEGMSPSTEQEFRFLCNSCGQKLSAREVAAGQSVKCPKCGNAISVPEPAAEPVDSKQKQEGVRYKKPDTFKFFCVRCGHRLEVMRDLAGTQHECDHCKNTINIPSPPDE